MELRCTMPIKRVVVNGAGDAEFDYKNATAYCRQGRLTKDNGEDRRFKNIFRKESNELKAYEEAERCDKYDDMRK